MKNKIRNFEHAVIVLASLFVFITVFHGIVAGQQDISGPQPGKVSNPQGDAKVPVVILFASKATESDKIGTVAFVGGEIKHKYSIINGMAAMVSPARMRELQKNPLVLSVDQDIEVKALDINAGKRIKADQVWVAGDTGQEVPVAILDTGIDNSHPEFSGRISKCHSEITNTDTCNDQNRHGTHAAGIAGAAGNLGTSNSDMAKGVAPNISFYIDQVLYANGSGSISGIIAGIDWATANGAKVISMSLGTNPVVITEPNCDDPVYGFSSLRDAINNAVSHGVTVVAAAGNSWPNPGVGAPACISSTIAVGAVDSTDTIAGFSSRGGPMADHGIVAPGVNIFSTFPGGYGTLSGTSMATPLVSGTVALMIKANSSLSPTSPTNQPIRSILFNTACNQITNPSCPTGTVPNTVYGYGRVDALRAYNAVATPSPPPPPVIKSITVSPSTASMTAGGTQKFNATALDQNSNPMAGINISWTSSNLTAGSITPLYAITGSDGNASATFTAPAAGNATVNATNGTVVGSAVVIINKKPLAGVTNLTNVSYAQKYIKWTWNDPEDPDFSKVMVYLDGKFKINVSKGKQYYNATSLKAGTQHTLSTRTVDTSGHINLTWVNHTATTAPDLISPASITNLMNVTYAQKYINWTWTDPKDSDFKWVKVFIDGKFKTNVTKGRQYYNLTGLTINTSHVISTHTEDTNGNINLTWVNNTARTAP